MKNNQKLSLLFWQRKSRAHASGFASIICRISIDSKSEEFSIGKKVHLSQWDGKAKKAIGGKEAKSVNQTMAIVSSDLERYFTVLQMECEEITFIDYWNNNIKPEIKEPVELRPKISTSNDADIPVENHIICSTS